MLQTPQSSRFSPTPMYTPPPLRAAHRGLTQVCLPKPLTPPLPHRLGGGGERGGMLSKVIQETFSDLLTWSHPERSRDGYKGK